MENVAENSETKIYEDFRKSYPEAEISFEETRRVFDEFRQNGGMNQEELPDDFGL